MYTGPGSGPMWAASAAWDTLGAELASAASSYRAVVSGLLREPWLGPAAMSMAAAATPYQAWMSSTGEQARQAANLARAAAMAFEAAFAATVPPALVTENRAMLAALVATNIFGQNTPAIAATETVYAEMWAQDATTMYGYAIGSAAATRLTPFLAPPQNTNPAGVGAQASAVAQAAGSAAGSNSAALSQLISTLPSVLQAMATGAALAPFTTALQDVTAGEFLNFISGWTFVASGVLFILGPVLEGPVNGLVGPLAAAGAYGPEAAAAALPSAAGVVGSGSTLGRAPVLAGAGRAASVGGLSVPQAWAQSAPGTSRAVTAIPQPTLAGFSEPAPDGMGPGLGGMLSGSLMAAAAGGGGAAGGGWAATRSAAAQRGAGAAAAGGAVQSGSQTPARYGLRPSVIPQVARALPGGAQGDSAWADQRAQAGEAALSENLRDEINDLRRQISELAMERDVLMRSMAIWARESIGSDPPRG
ncbi:hypothetical protein AWC27_12370 [Mycobacterium szulgai]|uniref:PPE family domain-containing protein n=2 Tax=Mycobacterium szulgai TaxID=1787 RepID=A0A1X2DNE7_MYCSZ|nr:hypothetical protein AWC27_12370 [Mycobacterium szulgai]